MDRITRDQEQSDEQARRRLIEQKQSRFGEVRHTFEGAIRTLGKLHCLCEISESVKEDLCTYTIITDRSVLNVAGDKERSKLSWTLYRKAFEMINKRLREGVSRRNILWPFSFLVIDKDGKRIIGWMISATGAMQDTK